MLPPWRYTPGTATAGALKVSVFCPSEWGTLMAMSTGGDVDPPVSR
jgi:hypothetical protein